MGCQTFSLLALLGFVPPTSCVTIYVYILHVCVYMYHKEVWFRFSSSIFMFSLGVLLLDIFVHLETKDECEILGSFMAHSSRRGGDSNLWGILVKACDGFRNQHLSNVSWLLGILLFENRMEKLEAEKTSWSFFSKEVVKIHTWNRRLPSFLAVHVNLGSVNMFIWFLDVEDV